jgi:hypothetical protein
MSATAAAFCRDHAPSRSGATRASPPRSSSGRPIMQPSLYV